MDDHSSHQETYARAIVNRIKHGLLSPRKMVWHRVDLERGLQLTMSDVGERDPSWTFRAAATYELYRAYT